MREPTRGPAPRIQGSTVLFVAVVGLVMLYLASRWWLRWAGGEPAVGEMTGGQWAEAIFQHGLCLVSVVAVVSWAWGKARSRQAEQAAAPLPTDGIGTPPPAGR